MMSRFLQKFGPNYKKRRRNHFSNSVFRHRSLSQPVKHFLDYLARLCNLNRSPTIELHSETHLVPIIKSLKKIKETAPRLLLIKKGWINNFFTFICKLCHILICPRQHWIRYFLWLWNKKIVFILQKYLF